MKGAALERHEALVHELRAAVHDLGCLGAVGERALRDVGDVVLVDLAEVGGEGVRDAALLADPGDGDGRVEAAREGDPDAFTDRQRLEDAAHGESVGAGVSLTRDLADGLLELGGAEGALEARPDDPVLVDDERERLALELPLVDPLVGALGRIVVLVDLDVDEVDAVLLPVLRDGLHDLDDRAARARLAVERRREGDDERAMGGHRRGDGRAQQLAVGRLRGRDGLRRDARLEDGVLRRDRPLPDLRCGGVLEDDRVAERLDLLAADRLGEDPVLAGLRHVEMRHVDVLGVGLGAAGDADRLERRGRLGVRLLLQPSCDPDVRRRLLDQPRLLVDDEERDAVLARPVVVCAGNDRDVLARLTPKRLQGSRRR